MRNLTIALLLLFAIGCEDAPNDPLCCAPPFEWVSQLYLSDIDSEGMTDGYGADVDSKIAMYYFSEERGKDPILPTGERIGPRYYFYKEFEVRMQESPYSPCSFHAQDVLLVNLSDLLDVSARRGEAVDFYLQIGDDIDTIRIKASYPTYRLGLHGPDTLRINGYDPLPMGLGVEINYAYAVSYYSKKWRQGEQKVPCPSDHKP